MSYPLRKGVSLQHHLASNSGANDIRNNGNSAIVLGSATRWVKVWVDWEHLMRGVRAPTSMADHWDQLNTVDGVRGENENPTPYPGPALKRLDTVIRYINDMSAQLGAQNGGSIAVILQIESSTPEWARKKGSNGVFPTSTTAFPQNVDGDSYWAWFVAHLCARYKAAPMNDPGPHYASPGRAANYTGNTAGAVIQALEIANEPNFFYDGTESDIACGVAQMTKTAESIAVWWGSPACLFTPGVLDGGDSSTPALSFTDKVLYSLKDWVPRIYVGWSMHNYGDVKYRGDMPASSTGVARMQALLTKYNWKGAGERIIWITESGHNTRNETLQESTVRKNFHQMESLSDVALVMTHLIVDPPLTDADGFFSGLERSDLSPKPIFSTWATPTSPTYLFGANTAL